VQQIQGHDMPIFFYLPLIVWAGFIEAAFAAGRPPDEIRMPH
jgi:hypothetical protein